jgi:hypothetical protein
MITIDECKTMVSLYIEAEKAVITGKKYRIGTRELERENLSEIRKARAEWEQRLKDLENGGKRRKIRGIIPRDL